jgi:hypothetical protein
MGMVVDSALYVGGHRNQSVSIEAATPPEQSDRFIRFPHRGFGLIGLLKSG